MVNNWFQKQWNSYGLWHVLLIPLSWLFSAITFCRKYFYDIGLLQKQRLNVPVIVVGNITVGGTGKTPMVIWLAGQLQGAGFKPGIISRGYGGTSKSATAVFANSQPQQVGDEPVLIAKRTNCPMYVGADRVAAGQALLKANPQCDIIISDDGLQHYALQRNVEIVMLSSNRQFGNQLLLPAGPLREKISRLKVADAIINSGTGAESRSPFEDDLPPVFNMKVQGTSFESLNGAKAAQPVSYFADKNLVAIAGIGSPERFFNQLSNLGLQFEQHAYADHHAFTAQDLAKFSGKTILMTEKDAVKCSVLTISDAWYLPIIAIVDSSSQGSLLTLILQKLRNK